MYVFSVSFIDRGYICMYNAMYIACMCSIVTWSGEPGGIEA